MEKRESEFAAFIHAHEARTEAMLSGAINRFALALSAQKVGSNPASEDDAEVRTQSG